MNTVQKVTPLPEPVMRMMKMIKDDIKDRSPSGIIML